MRRTRYVDPDRGFVDYHLNHLGVRVSEHECQLVARTDGHWNVVGPACPLPIEIPSDAETLQASANNVIALTAWQYDLECPGSDIRRLMSGRKAFATALDAEDTLGSQNDSHG